jgi:hypothetical protein
MMEMLFFNIEYKSSTTMNHTLRLQLQSSALGMKLGFGIGKGMKLTHSISLCNLMIILQINILAMVVLFITSFLVPKLHGMPSFLIERALHVQGGQLSNRMFR